MISMNEIIDFILSNNGKVILFVIIVPIAQLVFSGVYNEIDSFLIDKTHMWKKSISDFIYNFIVPVSSFIVCGITIYYKLYWVHTVVVIIATFFVLLLTKPGLNLMQAKSLAFSEIKKLEEKIYSAKQLKVIDDLRWIFMIPSSMIQTLLKYFFPLLLQVSFYFTLIISLPVFKWEIAILISFIVIVVYYYFNETLQIKKYLVGMEKLDDNFPYDSLFYYYMINGTKVYGEPQLMLFCQRYYIVNNSGEQFRVSILKSPSLENTSNILKKFIIKYLRRLSNSHKKSLIKLKKDIRNSKVKIDLNSYLTKISDIKLLIERSKMAEMLLEYSDEFITQILSLQ